MRRRLQPAQVEQLIADYRAGLATRELAERYGIGKTSIVKILRANGVTIRHQRLTSQQIEHAVELYADGISASHVARRLGVPSSSIYDALRRAGVAMRSPRA